SLIAMHQLSIDVYKQISVSLVEFLKHLNYLIQRPLPTQRKTLISMTVRSWCDVFNAADTHKAARSIYSNADRSHAIGPELRLMLGDMAGMTSFLPPHHTNTVPRSRRCHASRAARQASTYQTRRRLPRRAVAASAPDLAARL